MISEPPEPVASGGLGCSERHQLGRAVSSATCSEKSLSREVACLNSFTIENKALSSLPAVLLPFHLPSVGRKYQTQVSVQQEGVWQVVQCLPNADSRVPSPESGSLEADTETLHFNLLLRWPRDTPAFEDYF